MKSLVLSAFLVGGPVAGALVAAAPSSKHDWSLAWALLVTAVLVAAIIGLLEVVAQGNPNAARAKVRVPGDRARCRWAGVDVEGGSRAGRWC